MNENQAASIDTPEFQALMNKMMGRLRTADLTGYNLDVKAWGDSMKEVIAHIDANLMQEWLSGFSSCAEAADIIQEKTNCELVKMEARATAAESRAEKAEQYTQVALGIKDSLEARLAEIQRGVEGLQRYGFDGTFGGDFGKNSLGCYVKVDAVLALLQPQGQADTSGLPG